MTTERIEISSIDLAAIISALDYQDANISFSDGRATFSFTVNQRVRTLMVDFAAGKVQGNVSNVLKARRSLFNEIRGGRYGDFR